MAEEETHAPAAASLGLARYVLSTYMVVALLLAWFLDKVINTVWERFDDPDPQIVTPVAILIAIVAVVGTYRNERANAFSYEVATELSKVTWPTREELGKQSVVVIVVSIVSAMVLAIFDMGWSALTDFIY